MGCSGHDSWAQVRCTNISRPRYESLFFFIQLASGKRGEREKERGVPPKRDTEYITLLSVDNSADKLGNFYALALFHTTANHHHRKIFPAWV